MRAGKTGSFFFTRFYLKSCNLLQVMNSYPLKYRSWVASTFNIFATTVTIPLSESENPESPHGAASLAVTLPFSAVRTLQLMVVLLSFKKKGKRRKLKGNRKEAGQLTGNFPLFI